MASAWVLNARMSVQYIGNDEEMRGRSMQYRLRQHHSRGVARVLLSEGISTYTGSFESVSNQGSSRPESECTRRRRMNDTYRISLDVVLAVHPISNVSYASSLVWSYRTVGYIATKLGNPDICVWIDTPPHFNLAFEVRWICAVPMPTMRIHLACGARSVACSSVSFVPLHACIVIPHRGWPN
jgi:hypothetical protein